MQFDLVLLGGNLVSSTREESADVGILDGKIAAIGSLQGAPAKEVVSIRGLSLLPGVIDTQVHFREPGLEHKEDIESGTRAAVMGGVTTVLEMPNTTPATVSAEALADKVNRAKGNAWCNIGFFVGASAENIDQLLELERLPGTPGIKLFMGSSTGSLLVPDDDSVRAVLSQTKRRVPVHSEDHSRLEARRTEFENPSVKDHPLIRDAECARLCTERLIRIAGETGAKVHLLHVSTADEIPMVIAARNNGVDITSEVTPQHLWFAWPEAYEKWGSHVQMNPPIRSVEHRDALRAALKSGFFTVFGSDHAPHTLEEKAQPYPKSPSGIPGVQTLLSVLLTIGKNFDLFDLKTFVKMACEAPAELYGITGKGKIEEGMDADLIAIDEEATFTLEKRWLESKCGWSPFVGETLQAPPVHVWIGGEFAVRDRVRTANPLGTIPTFDPR